MSQDEKGEKRIVSREQYLQGLGLLTLAIHHRKIVDECVKALGKTLGEEPNLGDNYDFSNDAVYGDEGIDWLVGQLDVEVGDGDS